MPSIEALFKLTDRVAIVTGASRGLGEEMAEGLAEAGAALMICARRDEWLTPTLERFTRLGFRVDGMVADVSRPPDVQAVVDKAIATYGRIDILVNNAGIAGPNLKTWEYPPADWAQVMRVNLDSQFFCCRAIAPLMIAQNYGRIVNIASIAGKEGNPNASAYSVSKAGVVALTKSLGKELAGHDIAVNCITPAAAKTAIFDQMKQEHIDYMLSKIPRARFVKVEEIAALAAWCASADNSFTTGAVFDISGGRATY